MSAISIVGWEVKYEKLVKFLIDHRVGTCRGKYFTNRRDGRVRVVSCEMDDEEVGEQVEESMDEDEIMATSAQADYSGQCFCGNGDCWDTFGEGTIPDDAWIIQSKEHFDMDDDEARYHISLLNGTKPVNLSALEKISPENRAAVRAFAVEMGARDEEAKIYAVVSHD